MTYYGINSSSQYGSNFSSVLANSPPPFDDTVDEDDELVFQGTKDTRDASTDKHNDASHHFQGNDAVDEFGDFEAFADFKGSEKIDSANSEWFSPTDNKLSAFLPLQSKDQVTTSSCDGQVSGNDDFADFEGFRSCTSDNVPYDSKNAASPQCKYPNGVQNGITAVSKEDVDDFGAFAVGDNSSVEFEADFNHCSDDSNKTVNDQGESLNGDQSMEQKSLPHQQELNKLSVSETSQETTSHTKSSSVVKESNDSDDEFGEFSTPGMIGANLDAGYQDIPKTGLPRVTKDVSDINTVNQDIASALGKNSQQIETESQHFDDAESEGSGTHLKNETISHGDNQDKFGDFTCSDDTRQLSNDQYTDCADFNAFSVSPCQGEAEDISEDNSSSTITSCDQTDKEINSLESKHAESDKDVSHRANADLEWKVSGAKHGLSSDFAEPKVDDPDTFDAFASANCVKDREQDGFGDFNAFPQEPLENVTKPGSNNVLSGDVSTSETLVQKPKAGSGDVEETGIDNAMDDNFGDFNSVEQQKYTSDMEGILNAPKSSEITDDNFGDFRSIDSTPTGFEQYKADNKDFTEMSMADASKGATREEDEDLGDFNTFDSQQKGHVHHKADSRNSRESKMTVALGGSGWDDGDEDFGDFDTADSKTENLAQQKSASSDSGETITAVATKGLDEDFGDLDAFNSQTENKAITDEFGAFPENQMKANDTNDANQGFADVGAFSTAQSNKDNSSPPRPLEDTSSNDFAAFPDTQPSTSFAGVQKQTFQWEKKSQSPVLDHNVKQLPHATDKMSAIYLVTPCSNISTSELGKSVMLCFSAAEPLSRQDESVNNLNVKLQQEVPSQFKVWDHLKATVVDGSLRFQWKISLSQCKILTSLNVNVQSLPTVSNVRPEVQSLPPFALGLSLLEPTKGPFVPTAHPSIPDMNPAQCVFHSPSEVGTPDLNFGLRRVPSHTPVSDIKESSSDNISESSSLDLDFLGPNLPILGKDRKEFRSHYEDDLLGLSLDSGNLSEDKFKPRTQPAIEKKAVKTVWQCGDVTIPLASQETEVKLSKKGRALISELEDLAFMQSPVLMFPIKTT